LSRLKEQKAVPDTDALRRQAKQTLLEATSSGKLDDALSKLQRSKASPVTDDQFRQQLQDTLLEATADGRLEESLTNIAKNRDDQGKAPQGNLGELREQLKQTLFEATQDGRLQQTLSEKMAASGETTRATTADADLDAAKLKARNALNVALAPSSLELEELEDAKSKAREALIVALSQAPEDQELEAAKLKAQDALIGALAPDLSPSLGLSKAKARQALSNVLDEETDLEAVMSKARKALNDGEDPLLGALFDGIDTNQDNQISREEFAAAQKAGKLEDKPAMECSCGQMIAANADFCGSCGGKRAMANMMDTAVSKMISEMKNEFAKRDDQSASLASTMLELTKTVAALQAQVAEGSVSGSPVKGPPSP